MAGSSGRSWSRRCPGSACSTSRPSSPRRTGPQLAMKLNNFLASPAMKSWTEGEPIDLQRMLYGKGGKPRMAIFSIAHLGDAERMFFVSLLLLQVLGWVRSQSGTTSLRALLYMDEIFGYLPRWRTPRRRRRSSPCSSRRAPSASAWCSPRRTPWTWTTRPCRTPGRGSSDASDRAGPAAGARRSRGRGGRRRGRSTRRETMKILAGLKNRMFLMNNVHEDQALLRKPLGHVVPARASHPRPDQEAAARVQARSDWEAREAPAAAAGKPASGATKEGAAKAAAAKRPTCRSSHRRSPSFSCRLVCRPKGRRSSCTRPHAWA